MDQKPPRLRGQETHDLIRHKVAQVDTWEYRCPRPLAWLTSAAHLLSRVVKNDKTMRWWAWTVALALSRTRKFWPMRAPWWGRLWFSR